MRALKIVIGFLVGVFGTIFCIAAVHDLVAGGGKTSSGVLATALVFFAGVTFTGVQLARSALRTGPAKLKAPTQELIVLRAAEGAGGTIGAAQLAAHAGITFAEAKKALENLRDQGACEVIVDEKGGELFRFPDLALAPGEAARAKDVLDG